MVGSIKTTREERGREGGGGFERIFVVYVDESHTD